ncbi:MAG: tRNA (adenosine(37)-N6)-threonylcarbamoyltransferase complex ATPase subunit type 1 TsaE [Holosporales bacterium]
MMKLHLPNLEAMIRFAETLAAELQAPQLVYLKGDLGAGKSTLARAFIQVLTSPDMEVPSPTFTLVQTYQTPKGEVWHYDLYRLKHSEEIWELGFEDALHQGIVLVEWPERLEGVSFTNQPLVISLAHEGEGRRAVLDGEAALLGRLRHLEEGLP